MKQLKPLFLKTYGKQKRRVSAWFPNENRNQVFDSSLSTDGDISMYEPSKETRERMTSVSSHRVARPAKRKALQCLIEKSLKEDMSSPSCLQPAQQRKTTSAMKTLPSNIKANRPLKRKPKLHVTETSSDEENIRRPRPPRPTQQRKATRKKQHVCLPETSVRQKGHLISWISEREDSPSTAKNNKDSVQLKTDSDSRLPSVDRFVTRRRRTVAAKSKLPRAIFNVINSSDDFTSGAFESRRILRPSRRRRIPPSYVVSSAENSANIQGTSSFANNTLREISLNGLADNSLGMSPRKPIFCSTPSAGPFGERPCLKPIPLTHTTDQSATPPSLSVSCVGVLSTSQEDLASPGLSDLPLSAAPPIEQGDSCLKAKTIRCGKEAKSQSEDTKHMNGGESPSINFFSTEDLESSSQFLSAAGESEWMIEALKEQCLTVHCTVQLERLYNLTVNQLCSQTNYSSCLGYSDIGYRCQTLEPSFNLHLSVSNNNTSCFLKSVNTDESSERAASVTNSCSTNSLPPCSKEWTEQSTSELHVERCQHTGSDDFIVDTQIQNKSPMQTVVTEEDVAAINNTRLMKKCIVKLKTLSQLNDQQLKVSMQLKEGLTCNIKSENPAENTPENESRRNAITMKDLTCPGENTGTTMVSIGQPKQNSGRAAEIQSYDTEMEGEVVALTTMLNEKCLTDVLTVRIRRLTLSQLKEIHRFRDRNLKSQSEVSDSYTDGQIKNHHQSESDNNHSNEDSCATGVVLKKTGSSSSKEGISSDQEETYSDLHKRKKTSLVPKDKKRRSISTDRPGTTRKANVSGLSVNRWKNKDAARTHVFRSKTLQTGSSNAVDCSISEMISKKQEQPREVSGTTMNFITPLRASRLNLSSFLANLTPNTHTWSRLKAALSVHRKGMVQLTPRSPRLRDTPRKATLTDISQDLFASPFRGSLPKRLRSQLLEHNSSSLVLQEDADLSDAEKVYAECGQQHPLLWEECILPRRMKQCVKIGEGTFGEVFSMTNTSGEAVALKIIPVEGSEQVNGEDQKTFGEILHEIIISKELSRLKEKQQNQTHGFIGLNDLHCVQGCYPPDFLNAWDTFDQKKGSENDRPDFFEKDQVFIILEFEFGGIDLENSNGTLSSLEAAKSILHQVTAALAVAEQELHFEHRDLHWGNVLVKPTKQKKGSFLLNGAVHSLETKGVLVRIIDYSLSRLEIDDLTVSCDIANDEELFTGQGDYQFDIYRLMRQENGNNWSNYHPHTNVLWLHYLCSKLLSMKYRSSRGKGVREMKEALTRFHDNILQYRSATEVLQNCLMFQ